MRVSRCIRPLAEAHCEPCQGSIPPMTEEEYAPYIAELSSGWEIVEGKKLIKTFSFADFVSAVQFVNAITIIAESENHHPDLEVGWGRVVVRLWTHKIGGLSKSDFILAAKIDELSNREK